MNRLHPRMAKRKATSLAATGARTAAQQPARRLHATGVAAATLWVALFAPPGAAIAQPAAAVASVPAASPAAVSAPAQGLKDVVVDVVPAPNAAATPVPPPTGRSASQPGRSAVFTTPVHSAATAAALAELGLDLMRQHSSETGDAQGNGVVSPLSVGSALGLVHAGTSGVGARELGTLLGSGRTGQRVFSHQLPALLNQLAAPVSRAGRPAGPQPLTMANRVWLDQLAVSAVPQTYAAMVKDRYNADGAVLPFAKAEEARQTINNWVSQRTGKRIPTLMPAGSVTAATRVVVTNAIHFKSPWAKKFDAAATQPMPFAVAGGAPKMVPTMSDERTVLAGVVDNITVYEIPFAGDAYALLIGMPPPGHTLQALETDLAGLDMAAWSSRLKPQTCKLELPRFNIAPVSRALKPALQALGVKTVFTDQADFAPMLGSAARGMHLDNVHHSASITIDEDGGEAAAATGAAMVAKGFTPQVARCAVDRPFVFAVVHKASGAPLFVGKVADPSRS